MSDLTAADWSEPASKGDVVLVRKDMDLLRKDMDVLRRDMDVMRKDIDLHMEREFGGMRRRLDLQTVLVVLALLGSPFLSSLAVRYLPPLP